MSKNNRKDRVNVVYSTNPDFNYEYDMEEEQDTLPPQEQKLKVRKDTKKRKGKVVTLVEGFIGTEDDLKDLGKTLKNKCGTGGSAKDGEVIIQGDLVQKVKDILLQLGYNVK